MNDLRTRLLVVSLLAFLVSGCMTYRPRMFSYGSGQTEAIPVPAGANPQTPRLALATGTVLLQAGEGSPWREVQTGEPIEVGSLLRTEGGSEAILELPDGHGQVKVAANSCLEVARVDARLGTLLVISAGRISGDISGLPLQVVSSCGGGLTLTPNAGVTAPFEFRHGRDAEYVAVLLGLGRVADWAIFGPTPPAPWNYGEGLTHRTPVVPQSVAPIPEPSMWALFLTGSLALGAVLRKRR